jgi:hypothetical protein
LPSLSDFVLYYTYTPTIIRSLIFIVALTASITIMAQPQKPPNLDPNHVYIHITSPASPSTIASSLKTSEDGGIRYVGPVGELSGEHIFEVLQKGGPVKRDVGGAEAVGSGVVAALKGQEGVKGAKILEVKQRAKRGGEF